MFGHVLSATARKNLALVARTPLAQRFYLAGGPAVALHLGHRRSYDLDFFTPDRTFPPELPRQALAPLGELTVLHAGVRYSVFHLLKSLTYFEDAEPDPMPEMLVPLDWEEVKRFFEGEVRRLMRELL